MPHESSPGVPQRPSPDSLALAPEQIVPMLIGSTVGAIERELVLQTLALRRQPHPRRAHPRHVGAHAALQDPAIFR